MVLGAIMTDSAISIEDLEYSYGATRALRGISFNLSRGEILGFLGPNGAGKTTTVKILTGLLPPESGSVKVLGEELPRGAAKVQSRIGVSFEKTNLYEDMTAEENLKFYARLFGIRKYMPGPLLERVELVGKEKDRVSSYSKGMKQRLMVARSLINSPDILFLDEPTDGLDPVSAATIRRIIREEKSRGVSIFLTTHNMQEADKLSDRVAFINQGEIVTLDSPIALKQQYGERALNVEILDEHENIKEVKLPLGGEHIAAKMKDLMEKENVVTVHSAEATLEDIFIQITGRGLS
jgi:ABC-2 type transport system ATP-binding protein